MLTTSPPLRDQGEGHPQPFPWCVVKVTPITFICLASALLIAGRRWADVSFRELSFQKPWSLCLGGGTRSPEQPTEPDLQPVTLKVPEHVACSPCFSGSDAPISSRDLRTSAFTGTRALSPRISCAPLMKMKRTLSWRKARTHPATGLSGSRCGSPRRRAAVFREASADRPSHLTPRVSIAAWSGCGCVFPGIGPKQRHRKTRRIRNQFQASPEPACLRQTSAR